MYLISYDVSNDRIRNKIAKELENFGKRVQYSVFECRISELQLHKLYSSLVKLMQEDDAGNIRIYSICAKCEQKLQLIGIEDTLSATEEELFIV